MGIKIYDNLWFPISNFPFFFFFVKQCASRIIYLHTTTANQFFNPLLTTYFSCRKIRYVELVINRKSDEHLGFMLLPKNKIIVLFLYVWVVL